MISLFIILLVGSQGIDLYVFWLSKILALFLDFVEQVRHITLTPGECLSSYDVSALFTSVPIDPALNIIKDLLEKDPTLKDRTVMGVNDIILILEFCLKTPISPSYISSLNRLRVWP